MFLPVLLVRDYGLWGFVVFAVPNVVGAAAMGWVLRDGASERIVREHRAACAAFSWVTMVFQAYFMLVFLAPELFPTLFLGNDAPVSDVVRWLPAAAVVGGMLAFWRWGGVAAWVLSAFIVSHAVGSDGFHVLHAFRPRPGGLLWLAPVCAFGFALCPYLDLTFHRARRATSAGHARSAFGFGFGVLFLAAILTTLAYSGPAETTALEGGPAWTGALPLMAYVLLQLMYTIGVHADAVAERRSPRSPMAVIFMILAGVLASPLMYAAKVWGPSLSFGGLDPREVIYRLFMSFYGLVFPAYVWLCMIPTPDAHSGAAGPRGRLKLRVLAAAVALAAPFYWMGFIERREWWLAPGLGVVLLARLLVRSAPKPSPA
jgi:hypothetical protein